MASKKLGLVFSCVVALILPLSLYAQGGATGAIAGAVVDSKGVPVSNAQVEIVPAGSGTAARTVFSDASGNFTAASLPVGPTTSQSKRRDSPPASTAMSLSD